jgi:hypothetical protein
VVTYSLPSGLILWLAEAEGAELKTWTMLTLHCGMAENLTPPGAEISNQAQNLTEAMANCTTNLPDLG